MRRYEWAVLLAALAAYLGLRGPDLMGPLILPFETGFQEAIALHHLDQGIATNRFLPVISRFDGRNYFHSAHPPLLHIIYASIYRVIGVRDWAARGMSLILLTGE